MSDEPLMVTAEAARRELRRVIHHALIQQRKERIEGEGDADGYIEHQALHCPYYVPLGGEWGSDWGAIMHPDSQKFGQLVFEHEWCGCAIHPGVPLAALYLWEDE